MHTTMQLWPTNPVIPQVDWGKYALYAGIAAFVVWLIIAED